MLKALEGQVVIPGDSLLELPSSGKVRVGAGIWVENGHLVTSKSGIARQTKAGKVWVEGRQKRYIPTEGDSVIGLILERYGESWTVDIGGPFSATLPALAFEGVTRRSRPNLHPRDLIYARVTAAPRDTDPEIACTDASGKAAGFGALKEGFLLNCSTAMSRKLLASPTAPVLAAIGADVQYEIAVGVNARLWIRAANKRMTILVANAILNSEFLTTAQIQTMVKRLMAAAMQHQA